MVNNKVKKSENKRTILQLLWFALTNAYFKGFMTLRIYTGKLKVMCLPGLNCYSCAGALGSCPIGALQAVVGKKGHYFSYYVIGILIFIGALIGRLVCGFLCPFGLVQDLLHKIPFPKKIRTLPKEKYLVKIKYFILLMFVILMPMFIVNFIGNGDPFFCKLICPVGTLEGGIPLVLFQKIFRNAIGFLFAWKVTLLIITIVLSIIVYRPFCKMICPLGAIYSLFNRVSLYRYVVDMNKCIGCKLCSKNCYMNVDPVKESNALECIRCGKCKVVCPVNAITSGFMLREKPVQIELKTESK